MIQSQRGDRQHRDAPLVDDERVLVGAVGGAAVLDHAQPPRRDLLVHPMVQQDHAVGDVLFDALARELASLPRSPVMMAVTPLSLSQRNSRRSSARRMASSVNAAKRDSIVSSTTRLAPIESMA